MQKFKSVEELINQLKPTEPVYCIRKKSIQLASKFFQNKFPGKVLYAVKTNPHPIVLKTIIESGIENFDVASNKEIESIRKVKPNAKCSYMHTVKSRESIKKAYFKHKIKSFSLDTKDELIKIIESTNQAKDLELFVRLAVSNEHEEIEARTLSTDIVTFILNKLESDSGYLKILFLSFSSALIAFGLAPKADSLADNFIELPILLLN